MASGKPGVAFARGGALETVVEGEPVQTGVLFEEQSVEALCDAIGRVRSVAFDRDALRRFSLGFDREVYKAQMRRYTEARWEEFRAGSLQMEAGQGFRVVVR
jgi:glycosyltransferase involved in cell wall biosynthesis